jgi:1-deoxyxylulose-5-phosphate synthase
VTTGRVTTEDVVRLCCKRREEIGPDRIVLGGRFGEEEERLSFSRLDRFTAAGGKWVDTAYSYAEGRSQEVIGRWLRANPGGIAVANKVGHPTAEGVLSLSAPRLRHEIDESCQRLGVSAVDILFLHRDDPSRPVEELAETLLDLREAGFARRVGVSNWNAGRLEQLAAAFSKHHEIPVVSYQLSLAVPVRPVWPGTLHADRAILDVVRSYCLPLWAWAAQARGFFASAVDPSRNGEQDPFDTTDNRIKRQRCVTLAEQLGCRPETVALAWTLHIVGVWPIVGPRSLFELDASLAAASLPLDEATWRWLSSEPHVSGRAQLRRGQLRS